VGRRIAALLLSFLSLAALAVAATPRGGSWKSTYVEFGYEVKFRVSDGKVRKFSGVVLEQCGAGNGLSQTTVSVDRAMKIRRGKFSVRETVERDGVTVITTVKGRFTTPTKAVGTLRAESVAAGSTCDTHELDWKAKRV
jgi:hypothetical protein